MPNEPNNENVEVTPEWARELQESLSRLPQQIAEALNPAPQQDPEPSPEPQDPTEPIEIPLPQPPEPQDPPLPEPMQDPEPAPPKRKSLREWFF